MRVDFRARLEAGKAFQAGLHRVRRQGLGEYALEMEESSWQARLTFAAEADVGLLLPLSPIGRPDEGSMCRCCVDNTPHAFVVVIVERCMGFGDLEAFQAYARVVRAVPANGRGLCDDGECLSWREEVARWRQAALVRDQAQDGGWWR